MSYNENEQFLLQYLNMMLEVHKRNHKAFTGEDMLFLGPIDLLLQRAQFFPFRPLPANVPRMPVQQCFQNALKLATQRPELTYVEGYAISIMPVSHAWCIDRDGFVVDPTWVKNQGSVYFGLPFHTDYVWKTVGNSDSWSVLFDWMGDYPLCTGKQSLEEAVPKEWLNALA